MYAISVIRLLISIIVLISMVIVNITGKSRNPKDLTKYIPSPGQVNTVSVIGAPASNPPILNPKKVTSGNRTFLKACFQITSFSDNPLALAARI